MRKAAIERRRKEEENEREHAKNKEDWDKYQVMLKAYEQRQREIAEWEAKRERVEK